MQATWHRQIKPLQSVPQSWLHWRANLFKWALYTEKYRAIGAPEKLNKTWQWNRKQLLRESTKKKKKKKSLLIKVSTFHYNLTCDSWFWEFFLATAILMCQLNQAFRSFCHTNANHQNLVLGSTARTLQKHPLPSRAAVCGQGLQCQEQKQSTASVGILRGGHITYHHCCKTSFSNASLNCEFWSRQTLKMLPQNNEEQQLGEKKMLG